MAAEIGAINRDLAGNRGVGFLGGERLAGSLRFAKIVPDVTLN
jgi:hypothetical protein